MDLGRFETSLDVKDIERSLAFYKTPAAFGRRTAGSMSEPSVFAAAIAG